MDLSSNHTRGMQRTSRQLRQISLRALHFVYCPAIMSTRRSICCLSRFTSRLGRMSDHMSSRRKKVPDDFDFTMSATWSKMSFLMINNLWTCSEEEDFIKREPYCMYYNFVNMARCSGPNFGAYPFPYFV